jgi:hypothetical protein
VTSQISGGGTITVAVDVIVFTGDIIDEIDDVGAVSANGTSPGIFAGTVSSPRVLVNLETTKDPVTLRLS